MWRLIVPLKYWQIKHPDKLKFDLYVPAMLALVLMIPLLFPEFRTNSALPVAVIEKITSFIALLSGFFIAALAAIATFGGKGLDSQMLGNGKVELVHKSVGEPDVEPLTRRRFLSFLFGFLAFQSIICALLGIGVFFADQINISSYAPTLVKFGFPIFWVVYSFIIGTIISNTLLGLFYLTDRMHRHDRGITYRKDTQAPPHVPAE